MLRLDTPVYTVCTHTQSCWISHTHTLLLIVSESQDFPPQLFLTRHHTLLNDRPLPCQQFSPFPLYQSPQHTLTTFPQKKKKKHTSSISVPAFLLFPRQQWQRIFPRRTQPMALAVVWVVVLLGSVELAACVCAYLMFMWVCMYVCMLGEGIACTWMHARMHLRLHAFVQDNMWVSAAASVCVSKEAAEFSWESWREKQEREMVAREFLRLLTSSSHLKLFQLTWHDAN